MAAAYRCGELLIDPGTRQGCRAIAAAAVGRFGSGWAWLVKDADGKLSITKESNAGNPMTRGLVPVLTFDVWEHAYYIDYRNARAKFVEVFLASLANWDFASANYNA